MKDLMESIKDGDNILLTGGAGVGKTYQTNSIIEYLMANKIKFAVTAMTGLASQHLNFGMTIHRFLSIGNKTNINDLDELLCQSYFTDNLDSICHVKAIIIDEVSMMRPDFLELFDGVLKEARRLYNIKNNKLFDSSESLPFGGYQLIFVGDFCQLPPVVKSEEKLKYKWIFQHPIFISAKFRVFNLTEIKRTNDVIFSENLNKLRVGYYDESALDMLIKRVDKPLKKEGTVLMSKVNGVKYYNSQRLKHHSGDEIDLKGHFVVRDEIKDFEKKVKSLYFTAINESGLDKEINLKVGSRVMILSNNTLMNYSNGSQGILLGTKFFDEKNCTFTNKAGHIFDLDYKYFGECLHILLDNNENVIVPKKPYYIYGCSFDNKGKRLADIIYYQYPVTLGYAVSIHKSQGMSLDNMILDCANIFADGQFYVGISRAKSLEGLSIMNFNQNYIRADLDAVDFYINISQMNNGDIYNGGI